MWREKKVAWNWLIRQENRKCFLKFLTILFFVFCLTSMGGWPQRTTGKPALTRVPRAGALDRLHSATPLWSLYALKSLLQLHPVHHDKFPVNPQVYLKSSDERRNKENFIVNWAKRESYRMSAIPYMQRMLNDYVQKKKWDVNSTIFLLVNDNHLLIDHIEINYNNNNNNQIFR